MQSSASLSNSKLGSNHDSRSSYSKLRVSNESHSKHTPQNSRTSKPLNIPNKENMNSSTNNPRVSCRKKSEYPVQCQQQINQNLDHASLQEMIELLKQYEQVCLSKSDFSSAEQAKNKIEFLKSQEILIKQEQLENQDKRNMEEVSKQGQEEVVNFQADWDQQLQQLIQALKEVQRNLNEQHEMQLNQIESKLHDCKPPKIKYSSHVLELRKYLSNLIKVKNYKQAEDIKYKLEFKQREEQDKWIELHEMKKKSKLETVMKKQQNELNALRTKLEAVFNQKLKERDHKFSILLKKNRKRKIESGKISRERLKTKTALLNESKSYMQSTIGI